MKDWLSRLLVNSTRRGRAGSNEVTPWSRWLPRTPVVDPQEFQDDDEPFPGHWRRRPEAWPRRTERELAAALEEALSELPPRWRAVLTLRDRDGHSAPEVADRLGVSPRTQRAILNRARAHLRARLAAETPGRSSDGGDGATR